MKAQTGSKASPLPLLFCNLGDRWGWVVRAHPGRFILGNVTWWPIHCIGGCVGPTASLNGYGRCRFHPGLDSAICPVRSQSLHRLSYRYLVTFPVSIHVSYLNTKYLTITAKCINGTWLVRRSTVHIVVLHVVKYVSVETPCAL